MRHNTLQINNNCSNELETSTFRVLSLVISPFTPVSQLKFWCNFSPLPTTHPFCLTSFDFITLLAAKITTSEAPHYAVFPSLLLLPPAYVQTFPWAPCCTKMRKLTIRPIQNKDYNQNIKQPTFLCLNSYTEHYNVTAVRKTNRIHFPPCGKVKSSLAQEAELSTHSYSVCG